MGAEEVDGGAQLSKTVCRGGGFFPSTLVMERESTAGVLGRRLGFLSCSQVVVTMAIDLDHRFLIHAYISPKRKL